MKIKDTIIEIIKDSHFYHRYHCSKLYRRKLSKKGVSITALKAFFEVKPVFYQRRKADYPLERIRKMLLSSKVSHAMTGEFWFSLDERRICLYRDQVIGNIPVDFSCVIDSSIDELRNESAGKHNSIGDRNVQMLNIISECIDYNCTRLQANGSKAEHVIECLQAMKHRPAETLFEALQRILFISMLLWQTGHYLMGIGRLDKHLNRFPWNESTEKLLSDFMLAVHTYYEFKSNTLPGDTGQLIILGGLEADGTYFHNDYTSQIMRILGSLHLPDPKILLRSSVKMPQELLQEAGVCIATGCGSPLLSNDERVIPALRAFGYDEEDAYNYGVSACWEPLVIGNSLEQNNLCNIEFGRILNETVTGNEFLACSNFDMVVELYLSNLKQHVLELQKRLDRIKWEKDPLLTLLTSSCLESNRDIAEGGAKYSNYGLLSVGMASAVNSLVKIHRFLFDTHVITKEMLQECLRNDYEGLEAYRQLLNNAENGFGSDNPEAVSLTQKIMDEVQKCMESYRNPLGGKAKFGLSSPDYINLGTSTGATADGRKAGEPFSTHISGDGNNAVLDTVRFAAALDYGDCRSNGNVADIILTPAVTQDRKRLTDYLAGCIQSGIYQAQFNVMSYQTLLDAIRNPNLYKNLIVRVWGFSAYFNDLPETYKLQLLNRAKHSEGLS